MAGYRSEEWLFFARMPLQACPAAPMATPYRERYPLTQRCADFTRARAARTATRPLPLPLCVSVYEPLSRGWKRRTSSYQFFVGFQTFFLLQTTRFFPSQHMAVRRVHGKDWFADLPTGRDAWWNEKV